MAELVNSFEVVLAPSGVRLHRLGTRLPSCRTDLAVHIRILERLHQAQSLLDRPSDRQIVDRDLPKGALVVDDEEATERYTRRLVKHSVVARDLARLVGQQRNSQLAQTTLLAGGVDPGQVAEMAVGRGGNHAALDVFELLDRIGEGDNFSRAHKSTGITEV